MNMTNQQIFAAWAPEESVWSRWAKPVLFAHLDAASAEPATVERTFDASWSPPPAQKIAMVLDLPGADGVAVGVALAARGYRPVPLYNALPMPVWESPTEIAVGQAVAAKLPKIVAPLAEALLERAAREPAAAVNMWPIISAIKQAAKQLARLKLASDAPPAFLLDANRRGEGRTLRPEDFDNRSICFITDFPSAEFLTSNGIQKVMLIQLSALNPQADVAQNLRRWQEGGVALLRKRMDRPEAVEAFEISKLLWFKGLLQRFFSRFALRRAAGGAFGNWVPRAHAG
jgi:hypothetical protein